MHAPATRISFSRATAKTLADIDRERASQLAAEAARLIRELGCSPHFAQRHARARALAMLNGGRA